MGLVQEIFPGKLQIQLNRLDQYIDKIREIRIRANKPILIIMHDAEYGILRNGMISHFVSEKNMQYMVMDGKNLEDIFFHICHSSVYAYEEELKRGYVTIPGGHRIGIAGQIVSNENGQIKTIKNVSYMNIRVAHEIKGSADGLLDYLYWNGQVLNTLIISKPGLGKTTVLRDLIRQISDGNTYGMGKNCSVVDERSELAGSFRGIPQLDIGMRSDILDSCPKSVGMMMAIRSMAPEVVAVDELGTEEDIKALFSVIGSGCSVLATIHGENLESLQEKSYLKRVMNENIFKRYVVIMDKRHKMEVFDKDWHKC